MLRVGRLPRCVALCAALAGQAAGQDLGKPGTLKEELAAARKAGLPLTAKDLVRPKLPDAQNAAPLYRRLGQILYEKPIGQELAEVVEARAARTGASAADIAAARGFLAERRDLMDLIHEAAGKPACEFTRDWRQGTALQFPEYARLREAARLLAAEAAVRAADGSVDGAIRSCRMVLAIAHQASGDPNVVAHLVDSAIAHIGFRSLENVLRAHPDRETASSVIAAAAEYRGREPVHVMGGELMMARAAIAEVRKGGVDALDQMRDGHPSGLRRGAPFAQAMDANEAFLLWEYRHAADALRMPVPACLRRLAALSKNLDAACERNDRSIVLAGILVPQFDRFVQAYARAEAQRDALRSAAAVLAWRAEHGALPAALDACMKPVPVDPFDGKPMRYRVEGSGFVVYSVGETGKYAGAPRVVGQPFREAMVRWP